VTTKNDDYFESQQAAISTVTAALAVALGKFSQTPAVKVPLSHL